MTPFVHRLTGCRPTPLASYLKSLGILRLVAQQKDPAVRAFWRDDTFHLVTTLSADALRSFFLDEYSPTPVVGPWNGGSGFYEGDPREGLDAILASTSPRLEAYRSTIQSVMRWPELPATGVSIGELSRLLKRAADGMPDGKSRQGAETLLQDLSERLAAARTPAFDPKESTIESLPEDACAKGVQGTALKAVREVGKVASKIRNQLKGMVRKEGKGQIANGARLRLSDDALQWAETALLATSNQELKYPPLLGSGGNEGRLDYTGVFMGALTNVLVEPVPATQMLLDNALFSVPSGGLTESAVGQFDPGRAGGFNQGPEAETKIPGANPWNIVLATEGTLVWSSVVTRACELGATQLSSPFTVRARAVGYGSASPSDAENARAEVWAPLWARPLTWLELAKLFADGRAQWKGAPARDSLEFVRAASTLGTSRGIDRFVRFGLLKRRGESYAAVPTGTFVPDAVERSRVDLVRGLDPVVAEIDRLIYRIRNVPAALTSMRRRLDDGIYAALTRGQPADLQSILETLGEIERWISKNDRVRAEHLKHPLGAFQTGLDAAWLKGADDRSVEYRIAAALASIPRSDKVGPLRANLTPVDPLKPWQWARHGSQQHWIGGTFAQRLANVLRRRLLDEGRLGSSAPGKDGLRASLGEIAAFIDGRVDDSRIERLLFGLSLLKWNGARLDGAPDEQRPPHAYALLRLAFARKIGRDHVIPAESAILPLLLARRVPEACALAIRRLRSSGLDPVQCLAAETFRDASLDPERLAAALLIPVQVCRHNGQPNPYFGRVLRSVDFVEERLDGGSTASPHLHTQQGRLP